MSLCQLCWNKLSHQHQTGAFLHHKSWRSFCDSVHARCAICWAVWQNIRASPFEKLVRDRRPYSSSWTWLRSTLWLGEEQPVQHFSLCSFHSESCDLENFIATDITITQDICFHSVPCILKLTGDEQAETDYIVEPMNNLLRDEIFSESVLNTVRTWITQCQARHRICSRQRGAGLGIPRLPTRLLDLGTNGSTAWKVVETCQKREPYSKYAALSHRWTSNVPKLEGDNVATLKFGVGDHIVPQYYRDVFRLTRALGIRFLWIDSLCIQQDSEKDWTTEAVTMNDVYSNAFCTFSLCWQSEKSGISPCKGPRYNYNRIHLPASGTGLKPLPRLKLKTKQTLSRWLLPGQNTNATVTLDNIWDSSVTNSFLNQRGWVLQERVMSKRILYLGNEQLFWECDESTACEMAPYQVPNPQIFGPATEYSGSLIESSFPRPCADFTSVSNTTNNAIVFWRKIIEKYSKTDLTFEVDRLVAISAIASLVALETRDEYLAGLWKEQLIQQLLWIVGKKSKSLPTKEENKFEYIAPTWSWASFRGPVKFPIPHDPLLYMGESWDGYSPLAVFRDAFITPNGGEHGTIYGKLDAASLNVTCFQAPVTLMPMLKPYFDFKYGQKRPHNSMTEDEYGEAMPSEYVNRKKALVDFDFKRHFNPLNLTFQDVFGAENKQVSCYLDREIPWSGYLAESTMRCIFVPLMTWYDSHHQSDHAPTLIEGLFLRPAIPDLYKKSSRFDSTTTSTLPMRGTQYTRLGPMALCDSEIRYILPSMIECLQQRRDAPNETPTTFELDTLAVLEKIATISPKRERISIENASSEAVKAGVKWGDITLI